jgi:alpha-ribazole phosphatase
MTKIILIRHGLTVWNHEMRYQGHADVPLAEEGHRQAEKVAKRLATEKLSAVYASDLGRACQTAQTVANQHQLPVTLLPALREINFGLWEGCTYQELQRDYPEVIRYWFDRPADTVIPQGETFRDVKERAYGAILEVVKKHPGECVAVVSHGGTIRTLLCAVLDLDLNKVWQIKQDNTAVNVLEFYDTKALVSLVNDTHHLQQE